MWVILQSVESLVIQMVVWQNECCSTYEILIVRLKFGLPADVDCDGLGGDDDDDGDSDGDGGGGDGDGGGASDGGGGCGDDEV